MNYPKTENPDDVKHLGAAPLVPYGRCGASSANLVLRTAEAGGPATLLANEILMGAARQAIAMARLVSASRKIP
jgi:hypothetical protein